MPSHKCATDNAADVKRRRSQMIRLATSQATRTASFLHHCDSFKAKVDLCIDPETRNAPISAEFERVQEEFVEKWRAVLQNGLKERAKAAGYADPTDLPRAFATKHIRHIEDLGYRLDDKMKAALERALERFYLCDIGPAPFSVHAVEEDGKNASNNDMTITISEHQLQVATHWLRHPPSCFTVDELDELVVLSLFHDVYYFDDFAHHGDRAVELFEPYLFYERPKELIGGHIYLKPDEGKVRRQSFGEDAFEALKQEWVQMDWYLSMVNLKKCSKRHMGNLGDAVVLPLEFFHHHLGRVLTRQLIVQRAECFSENNSDPTVPAWSISEVGESESDGSHEPEGDDSQA